MNPYTVFKHKYFWPVQIRIDPAVLDGRLISYTKVWNCEGANFYRGEKLIAENVMELRPGEKWDIPAGEITVAFPAGCRHLCVMPDEGYKITDVKFGERYEATGHSFDGQSFVVEFAPTNSEIF